jgi:hypothetical protein
MDFTPVSNSNRGLNVNKQSCNNKRKKRISMIRFDCENEAHEISLLKQQIDNLKVEKKRVQSELENKYAYRIFLFITILNFVFLNES